MAKVKKDGLNDQQIKFCQAYAIHHNGAKAVRECGYNQKRPDQYAYELLSEPEIKAYIRVLEDEAAYSCKITKEMVVKHLADVGFSSGKGMTKIMALKYLGDALGAFEREKAPDAGGGMDADIAAVSGALGKAQKV